MTTQDKINSALAFLGPLLFEEQTEGGGPIQITFPSAGEAHYTDPQGTGFTNTVKFNGQNPLKRVLSEVVGYSFVEEQKFWEMGVREIYSEEDYTIDENGDIVYDPDLCTDCHYHSLRLCAEMIWENADD